MSRSTSVITKKPKIIRVAFHPDDFKRFQKFLEARRQHASVYGRDLFLRQIEDWERETARAQGATSGV